MGVQKLIIETVGQGKNGNPEGILIGIVDAKDFRAKILFARDSLMHGCNFTTSNFG
ncbi:MAG: hypothetical protein MI717_13045 [Spirochaetales bacterium]|nr:hypothetical protein [Spirochaetales bacterium]